MMWCPFNPDGDTFWEEQAWNLRGQSPLGHSEGPPGHD